MKEATRKFNLTYDDLRFKVGDIIGYMSRDETEFVARGITSVDRNAFDAQGKVFEMFPTDDYYQGQVTIEVQAKDAARESTMAKVRILASQVQQIFGSKSGQYKMLGMKDLNKKTDGLFITLARGVARVGEDYLAELAAAGLTQDQIDAIIADAQLMEDKFHAVKNKEALRDNKTEERINLANALYDKLAQYCAIGKSIWDGVSKAKYNDYVIKPTVHHSLPKVQNLVAVPNANDQFIADLTWDAANGATEYRVYQSQVIAGSPAGEFEPIEELDITIYNAQMESGFTFYWKVRAINADLQGSFSNEVSLTPSENKE